MCSNHCPPLAQPSRTGRAGGLAQRTHLQACAWSRCQTPRTELPRERKHCWNPNIRTRTRGFQQAGSQIMQGHGPQAGGIAGSSSVNTSSDPAPAGRLTWSCRWPWQGPEVHQHSMCDSGVSGSTRGVSSPHLTRRKVRQTQGMIVLDPSWPLTAFAETSPASPGAASPTPGLAGSLTSKGTSGQRSGPTKASQLGPQLTHRSTHWPIRLHSPPSR